MKSRTVELQLSIIELETTIQDTTIFEAFLVQKFCFEEIILEFDIMEQFQIVCHNRYHLLVE